MSTKDMTKRQKFLKQVVKRKSAPQVKQIWGLTAKESLGKIAREYKKRYSGPHYRKMKNRGVTKPWTRIELGLESPDDPDPMKAPVLEKFSKGKAAGPDMLLDNTIRYNPKAREKVFKFIEDIFNG